MIGVLAGFWISRSVYVAAKLSVADLLAAGPKTVEQLAIETGSHAPSLYRLLRGLASHGIFREEQHHLFVNTPTSDMLRTDVEGSLRYPLMMTMGGEHYDAWGNMLHAVKTGETAFDAKFGESIWPFFERNPENARIFDQAMTDFTRSVDPALLRAYDFSPFKHVIDIGGGHGAMISAIVKKHAHLRGTVFDQPYVAAQALKALAASGLNGRCNAVGGDFFEAVPAGGDCYTMTFILHDWDEQKSARILLNIRKAIAKHGKLLVIDTVVQEGNGQDFAKLMDLNMLAMTGGRERTAKEFATLLKAGGFQLTKVIKTDSFFGIVEAVPAV
jgi:hypothetical protein